MADEPDYWCLVALNYSADCAFIMAESDDCIIDDVLYDPSCRQHGWNVFSTIGADWAKDRPAGLYRLALSIDETDAVGVSDVEVLVVFPPLPEDDDDAAGPDYLNITKETEAAMPVTEPLSVICPDGRIRTMMPDIGDPDHSLMGIVEINGMQIKGEVRQYEGHYHFTPTCLS